MTEQTKRTTIVLFSGIMIKQWRLYYCKWCHAYDHEVTIFHTFGD